MEAYPEIRLQAIFHDEKLKYPNFGKIMGKMREVTCLGQFEKDSKNFFVYVPINSKTTNVTYAKYLYLSQRADAEQKMPKKNAVNAPPS